MSWDGILKRYGSVLIGRMEPCECLLVRHLGDFNRAASRTMFVHTSIICKTIGCKAIGHGKFPSDPDTPTHDRTCPAASSCLLKYTLQNSHTHTHHRHSKFVNVRVDQNLENPTFHMGQHPQQTTCFQPNSAVCILCDSDVSETSHI